VKRHSLDQWTARLLALGALGSVAAAATGRELHGRPIVSLLQQVELGLILAFVLWGLFRLLLQRPGFFSYFVIAIAALWEGLEMLPTLLRGFVLISEPPFVARTATILALGTGICLLLMVFRLYDQRDPRSTQERVPGDALGHQGESDWEFA
jgi:hypothetical protein